MKVPIQSPINMHSPAVAVIMTFSTVSVEDRSFLVSVKAFNSEPEAVGPMKKYHFEGALTKYWYTKSTKIGLPDGKGIWWARRDLDS